MIRFNSPISFRTSAALLLLLLTSFKPAWSAISSPPPETSTANANSVSVMHPVNNEAFLQASALLNQAAMILYKVNLAQDFSATPVSLTEAFTNAAAASGANQPESSSFQYKIKKNGFDLDEPWQVSSANGLIINDDGMVVPHTDDFGHDSHSSPVKRLTQASSSSTLQSFFHFLIPVQNALVTSPFGSRWGRPHQGVDMAAPTGTSVVAAESGRIIYSGWKQGYGNFVAIDHGHGMTTHYAHCSRIVARVGRSVKKGEIIAKVGNTGFSTGPHLHFEVLAQGVHRNPVKYLNRAVAVVQR